MPKTTKTKKNVVNQAADVNAAVSKGAVIASVMNNEFENGEDNMQPTLSIEETAERIGITVDKLNGVISDIRKICVGKKKTPGVVTILAGQTISGAAIDSPFSGEISPSQVWNFLPLIARITTYPDNKKLDNEAVSFGVFIAKITKKGNLRIVYSHNCKDNFDLADATYTRAVNELSAEYMFVAPSFED